MSHACSPRSCHGCCGSLNRRWFLKSCGVGAAVVAAETLWPRAASFAGESASSPVRVAAVFLTSMNTNEIWPYPGFDTRGRQEEVLTALRQGCPGIEFHAVTMENPADLSGVTALKDQVQGILVYVMTLDWVQVQTVAAIGQLRKPMLVVDEFLGGCGAFLIACSGLPAQGVSAAAVSTTKLEDVIQVARVFGDLRSPDVTPEKFAQRCETVYRTTFPRRQDPRCQEDRLQLTGIGQCVERFRQASFLVVGAGNAGQEQSFLARRRGTWISTNCRHCTTPYHPTRRPSGRIGGASTQRRWLPEPLSNPASRLRKHCIMRVACTWRRWRWLRSITPTV